MKGFDDLNFEVPEEISCYTTHSAEIAIMIQNYIRSTEGMNQSKFSVLVGKPENDISYWISGSHNFTLMTISLIEAKTGMSIILNLTDAQIKSSIASEPFKL